ncbi:MAG: GlsB/YeaQ/YmgE family stress response membrane protein [Armatimonadota bacterium]
MGIFGWIILGGVAGCIASLVLGEKQGCFTNVVVGIIGALLGGLIFQALGRQSVTGFNLWSVFVATVGSGLLILAFRALRGPQV